MEENQAVPQPQAESTTELKQNNYSYLYAMTILTLILFGIGGFYTYARLQKPSTAQPIQLISPTIQPDIISPITSDNTKLKSETLISEEETTLKGYISPYSWSKSEASFDYEHCHDYQDVEGSTVFQPEGLNVYYRVIFGQVVNDIDILKDKVHLITYKKVNPRDIITFLKKRGYLLIEFANKRNLKATFREFLKGNFTFPLDIFTKDMRSKRSITKGSIAFLNYHPDMIQYKLESHSFRVKDKLSVSNIRSPFLKKLLPTEILLIFERILQKPLGVFYFGPSIFVLAQKKG